MEWFFSWEVVSVVVGIFITMGLGVLATDDFGLTRLFFVLAAIDAVGGAVMLAEKTDLPTWGKALLVFLVAGAIGVAALYSLNYVNKKQKAKERLRGSVPPIERTVKFAVMIPYDTAPNSFPIPMDENPDDPLFRTYGDMHSLATNGTVPEAARGATGEGQTSWQSRSISMEEAPVFLGKLFQYFVFECIDSLQRNSIRVSLGYPAEARAGIDPPNGEPYPYEKLSLELANNVFFKPFVHRPSGDEMTWKLKPVTMPRGTRISFVEMSKPSRYLVRLQRPDYFNVDFVVEGFAGTGVGQVPKHFVTNRVSTIMQWTFFVTMHYTIEHPDDADFNPSSYAQWLDALYDGLRKRLIAD